MESGFFGSLGGSEKKYMLLMIILFALVFISGCTGPERQELSREPGNGNPWFPNWWSLVIIGLMLSVMLIVFSFMGGEAFNLPNLKAFAKQEVYELLSTIIIVVVIVAGLYVYGMFAQHIVTNASLIKNPDYAYVGLCNENQHIYNINDPQKPENMLFADVDWFLGCSPFADASQTYQVQMDELHKWQGTTVEGTYSQLSAYEQLWTSEKSKGILAGHMMNIYASLFSLEMLLGPVSTFGVSAYLPEPIISSISLDLAPNAGLTPVSEAMIMLTDLVGVGVGVVIVQKVLLLFIHQNALMVFLPLGVAFKCIPILRKTGATILAAALVMYFIYPISIWMNQQIYFYILDPPQSTGQVSHMIDWTNYHSMLELCKPQPGDTQEIFEERVKNTLAGNLKTQSKGGIKIITDIWTSAKGETDVAMPESQQNALEKRGGQNFLLVLDYMTNLWSAFGPVLPVEYFFEGLVDQFTTSMQWFVLNLLFIVNTILICLTLFKDLSLAIGGEPRIFGMTKLV